MLKYEDYYCGYPVIYRLSKMLAKVITFMTNSYSIFCLGAKDLVDSFLMATFIRLCLFVDF